MYMSLLRFFVLILKVYDMHTGKVLLPVLCNKTYCNVYDYVLQKQYRHRMKVKLVAIYIHNIVRYMYASNFVLYVKPFLTVV